MNAASLRGKFAVSATDRTPSSRTSWNVSRHVDCCECLTATGPLLHVMSLGEGCDATDPTVKLSVDKEVSAFERGRLQGFPEWLIDINEKFPDDAVKAFGSAMSLPVLAAAGYTAYAQLWSLSPTRHS